MLTALSLTKAGTAPCVQVSTEPLFLLWEERNRRQLRDNKPTASILEHFSGAPNLPPEPSFDFVIIVIVLIIATFKSLRLLSSLHHIVF